MMARVTVAGRRLASRQGNQFQASLGGGGGRGEFSQISNSSPPTETPGTKKESFNQKGSFPNLMRPIDESPMEKPTSGEQRPIL